MGNLRRLATAGIMAAVLFTGPAAMVVPESSRQVAAQAPSAGPEQLPLPAASPAPETAKDRAPETPNTAPAPVTRQPGKSLPWITASTPVPLAPGDIGAPYSGQLAAPKADGLMVHTTPGGPAFGLLPARVIDSEGSDRTWLPVLGSTNGEWLQVLLPARRNLPSTGAPVNGAIGWIRASGTDIKKSAVTVDVDLTTKTITVAEGTTALAVFPVSISGGDATARGRSFVMGRYTTSLSEQCSAQPMLILSAQSESADGYFQQDTAVQAIHAFSADCRAVSGYTQATTGCIIAEEADLPRLLALVPDGTPVTVRG